MEAARSTGVLCLGLAVACGALAADDPLGYAAAGAVGAACGFVLASVAALPAAPAGAALGAACAMYHAYRKRGGDKE